MKAATRRPLKKHAVLPLKVPDMEQCFITNIFAILPLVMRAGNAEVTARQSSTADVAIGSFSDLVAVQTDVSFTPESRHSATTCEYPVRATSGSGKPF
jgi:hypothetical protein